MFINPLTGTQMSQQETSIAVRALLDGLYSRYSTERNRCV